jgi:hypothetical protein
MRRAVAVILMLLLASFGRAQQPATAPATTVPGTSAGAVRFQTVDVTLDPKGQPLAAYQLEFVADEGRVKLVGVEGGDHAAYREPPYYDPAALSRHRVIVAAFSTSADLPRTPVRVARLHVQVSGDGPPQWTAKLIVASSNQSPSIPADVRVSEGAKP